MKDKTVLFFFQYWRNLLECLISTIQGKCTFVVVRVDNQATKYIHKTNSLLEVLLSLSEFLYLIHAVNKCSLKWTGKPIVLRGRTCSCKGSEKVTYTNLINFFLFSCATLTFQVLFLIWKILLWQLFSSEIVSSQVLRYWQNQQTSQNIMNFSSYGQKRKKNSIKGVG